MTGSWIIWRLLQSHVWHGGRENSKTRTCYWRATCVCCTLLAFSRHGSPGIVNCLLSSLVPRANVQMSKLHCILWLGLRSHLWSLFPHSIGCKEVTAHLDSKGRDVNFSSWWESVKVRSRGDVRFLRPSLENVICHIQEGHYWSSRTATRFEAQIPVLLLHHADASIALFAWMKVLMLFKRKVET